MESEEIKKSKEIDKEISEITDAIKELPHREILLIKDRSGFEIEFSSSKFDVNQLCSIAIEMRERFESKNNLTRGYIG